MMNYIKKYPLSIIIIGVILFLSFFNPPDTPLNQVTNIDKVLHFLMYFGFCSVLWFEYLMSHEHNDARRLVPWAIIAPILFSGLIEIGQQTLTPTRAGDWWDFLFNTLGCLAAVLFSQFVTRRVVRCWKAKREQRTSS
ncbi:MAG: VanZ family protein [Bacteroidaceae bacterium]|nr:VanZ family protein [Bacteroidaceae bacterium]